MNEYQIVPYNFTIHVLGKPNEKRNLDDVDAAGLSAVEFIAQAARAHLGAPRLKKPTDTTAMQVQQVSKSDRVATIIAGSAQRGVVSEVAHKGKATRTMITEDDWTHTHLRNAFFVPPGSTVGVALIERVGNTGVRTKLEEMLKESLKARYPDLVLTMLPSMSPEAIETWAASARIKSIVLRHTHQTTGESTAKVGGLPFGQVLTITAPRDHSWPPELFGGQLNKEAQKKIMTEVVPQLPGVQDERAAEVAQQMMNDGWEVSLGMKKGSRQRLVKVSTTVSITMTFPASLGGASTKRPTHDEFVEACQSALQEMSDDNMSVGQPKLCSWDDQPWDDGGQAWKAVWGVSESDATSSTS